MDLSGQRAAWTLAWWSRFRAKAGRTKLDREEFTVLFGGELDRLLSAGMEEARDGARAALRHTAVCLLRRGVPLDEALLAATTCGDAARDVAEVDDGTADALIALERTRTAAYAEVFVDGERLRGSGCSANLGFDGAELPAKAKLHHWGLVGDSPAMARVRTL
ncbi:MAG: hypothetical protein FJ100_23125, partial [Deltaproteobacteria bacterium]|nr:hypothetical protein [Deltaproteobacteria bacterium]